MSLLAETIVEEWLNRQGYFTMRGIRQGVDEIDILAVRPNVDSSVEGIHVEVQASVRPVSYLTKLDDLCSPNLPKYTTSAAADLVDIIELYSK